MGDSPMGLGILGAHWFAHVIHTSESPVPHSPTIFYDSRNAATTQRELPLRCCFRCVVAALREADLGWLHTVRGMKTQSILSIPSKNPAFRYPPIRGNLTHFLSSILFPFSLFTFPTSLFSPIARSGRTFGRRWGRSVCACGENKSARRRRASDRTGGARPRPHRIFRLRNRAA